MALDGIPPTLVVAALGAMVGAFASASAVWLIVRRAAVRERAAVRRAQAAERLAEIGSMTGGLAHEIKNPLSTIGLNAQLLAEGIADLPSIDDADRGRLVRRVEALGRETDRLRGILEDFLEYAGELRLDAKAADLNEAVSELIDFFHPQAHSRGVLVRSELSLEPVPARLDVPHVKQAVLNLMLNAVQAMSGSTDRPRELILRTERATDPDGSATAVLHVIDTGPGIAAEDMERIFRPYFTTTTAGSGLGLPTTRRIVEAHGGRIETLTKLGTGTDFVLTFPAGEPESAG